MEHLQRGLKGVKGLGRVDLQLGVVDKVDSGCHCSQNIQLYCTSKKPYKNLLHLLVFMACPLRDERDPILEMSETWIIRCRCDVSWGAGVRSEGLCFLDSL